MRVADSDYILALHRGERVVNYATFTLSNGTVKELTPADFRISGNNYTDKTTDGNAFSVGSFIGKTVNICIDNSTGKFDGLDFYMSTFILRESIGIRQGTSVTPKHVSIGKFTVVTDYTPGSIISFNAVDDSYKFDKKHTLTGLKTFKEIVSIACTDCLGSSTFDATGNFDLHNTQVDTSKIDASVTWRQVVSYVAAAAGYNVYIDATGLLKFKWYDYSVFNEDGLDGGTFNTTTTPYSDGDNADGGDFTFSESTDYDGGTFTDAQDYHLIQTYKNFEMGTYDISITGVRVINDKTVVESPSSHDYGYSYVIEVKDNPLCKGIESTIASHLGGKLNDFTFRTFSCEVLCDPLIEAGDSALVVDTKGVEHRTIINTVEFSTGGRTRIACQAESIIRQQSSYTSEAAKAVVEANRHTDNSISTYDAAVQRMNDLAQNALGMYTASVTLEDGSVIRYESDHAITYNTDGSVRFTLHSFVCKNAGTGYFYSTDAGLTDESTTWTGGIDRNGNAVLNTIAVYKLQAEWVIAGILSDQAGKNFWDLDTGDLQMTGGAKLKLESTDYSGAYVPTMGNSPASSWTTSTANKAGIGKTFKDTSTNGKIYIYRDVDMTYPETAHPYANSDDKKYLIRTGLTAPVKIKFHGSCETEANYDYLDVFYTDGTSWYKTRMEGIFGGAEVIVPSNNIYLVWHTDSSVQKWGFAISSITETDESPSTFTEEQIPSGNIINVNAYIWEEVTIDNFTKLTSQKEITENMTQEEIFNALTGGGAEQGIYIHNGKVYLNATYMQIGDLSANRIKGGTLILGGNSTSWTKMNVEDNNGNYLGGIADAWYANELYVYGADNPEGWNEISILNGGDGWRNIGVPNTNASRTYQYTYRPYVAGQMIDLYPHDILYRIELLDANGDPVAYYDTFGSSELKYRDNSSYTTPVSFAYADAVNTDGEIGPAYAGTSSVIYEIPKNFGNEAGEYIMLTLTINNQQTLYNAGVRRIRIKFSYYYYVVGIRADGIYGNHRGTFNGYANIYDSGANLFLDNANREIHIVNTTTDRMDIAYDDITQTVSGTAKHPIWSASDERVKEDIKPLDVDLSKSLIDATKPKRFKFKNTDGIHYGVTAQDMREILDNIGETESELEHSMGLSEEKTGLDDERMVEYLEFIPHLINYVKDLQAQIDDLKEEIKMLKGDK